MWGGDPLKSVLALLIPLWIPLWIPLGISWSKIFEWQIPSVEDRFQLQTHVRLSMATEQHDHDLPLTASELQSGRNHDHTKLRNLPTAVYSSPERSGPAVEAKSTGSACPELQTLARPPTAERRHAETRCPRRSTSCKVSVSMQNGS